MIKNFKFISIQLLCFILWIPVNGQNYFEKLITFNDTLNNTLVALKILPTLDNNYLLFTGRNNNTTNYNEITLTKVDSNGTELWTSKIRCQVRAFYQGITEFSDSTFYVSGFMTDTSYYGFTIIHISKDGLFLSASNVESPDALIGYGIDIIPLSDSTLSVLTKNSYSNSHRLGNVIWNTSGNLVSNRFLSINNKLTEDGKYATSPDGGYVQSLLIRRPGTITERILGVMKSDENGNIIWAKQLGSLSSDYHIKDIEHLQSGEIIICGSYYENNNQRGFIFCLDSSGNINWSKYYVFPNCYINSITPNDSGSFVISGTYHDTIFKAKALFATISTSGTLLDYALYRYNDLSMAYSDIVKGNDQMFYSVRIVNVLGTPFTGQLINRFDTQFNFCESYNLSFIDSIVTLADSMQWADTTYSLISYDVTSLFSQAFEPWGLQDHCLTTGISYSDETELQFEVFPNPSSGIFNLRLNHGTTDNFRFEVYDILGKRVMTGIPENWNSMIDLSKYNKGIYLLQVMIGTNRFVRKLIVN